MTPGCLAANPEQTASQDSFQSFAEWRSQKELRNQEFKLRKLPRGTFIDYGALHPPLGKTIHEADDVGRLKFSLECLDVLGELVSWGSLEPLWGCPRPQQL